MKILSKKEDISISGHIKNHKVYIGLSLHLFTLEQIRMVSANKVVKENRMLKNELELAKNTKLIKKLIHNLEDLKKGNFVTRDKIGF